MSSPATPWHLFNTTVTTQRATVTYDASGSPISTYATNLSNIRARVQPQGGSDGLLLGTQRDQQTFTVFVAGGQDIVASDRVVWGTHTMRITGPPKNPQGIDCILRLDCQDIEQ